VPVTIVSPLTGEPFGPGFLVTVETDFIGPLATDAFWQFQLTAPPNEDVLLTARWAFPVTPLSARMVGNTSTPSSLATVTPLSVTGQDAQLVVSLDSLSTSFHEDATVQVVLDRNAGQVQELAFWLQDHIATPVQELTTDQGEQLTRVESAIAISAGINPLELVGDVVQAIATHNPLGYGSLSVVYTISGDGELPNEDPILPKWGVYWIATAIPAGLGHRHGQSEEYPIRLIQWRTVHEVGGTEMVTAINDSETHGELWRFPTQTPRRLEYSILPGVVIQAQWWQFP